MAKIPDALPTRGDKPLDTRDAGSVTTAVTSDKSAMGRTIRDDYAAAYENHTYQNGLTYAQDYLTAGAAVEASASDSRAALTQALLGAGISEQDTGKILNTVFTSNTSDAGAVTGAVGGELERTLNSQYAALRNNPTDRAAVEKWADSYMYAAAILHTPVKDASTALVGALEKAGVSPELAGGIIQARTGWLPENDNLSLHPRPEPSADGQLFYVTSAPGTTLQARTDQGLVVAKDLQTQGKGNAEIESALRAWAGAQGIDAKMTDQVVAAVLKKLTQAPAKEPPKEPSTTTQTPEA